MSTIFALIIIYQLKHFIADYPLQSRYMLGKFKDGSGFVLPLAAHAGVHAAFTFIIAFDFLCGKPTSAMVGNIAGAALVAIRLAAFDFAMHFIMDRIKAGRKYLGRFKPLSPSEYAVMKAYDEKPEEAAALYGKIPYGAAAEALNSNKYFWWALGLDQMVHHLTHYLIIYILVTR